MLYWVLSGAALFWVLVLAIYSRKRRREKWEWDRDMKAVKERMYELRHARNVSDARLSMIRHITDQALKEAKGPYRSWAINPIEVFVKVGELVDEAMAENCREVGHFRDLQEATTFINTLPQKSNAYCFPLRMWDGDCYHVVYSVPEPTEIPPGGVDVRK
jgi:hypothetical protein